MIIMVFVAKRFFVFVIFVDFAMLRLSATASDPAANDDTADASRDGIKIRRQRNLFKKDFRFPDTEYGPQWTLVMSEQPRLYMKLQHESITLKCPAEGRPKPNITWFKDGLHLDLDSQTPSPKYEKSRFGLKILDLMSPFDRGNYTCVVTNRHGSLNHTYSIDVVVRLIGAPELTIGPRNRTVVEGDSIQMTCSYYSDMESFVYWVKHYTVNGSDVDSSGKLYAQLLQRSGGDGHDETEWRIGKAKFSDSGSYSCCVTNVYGTTCRRAWIQVVTKKGKSKSRSPSLILLTIPVAILICLFILIATVFAIICVRRRRRRHRRIIFKDPDVLNPIYLNLVHTELDKSLEIPFDSHWMIPASELQVEALIGEGAFGLVYLGQLTQSNVKNKSVTSQQKTPVAVKMLKDGGTEEYLKCFLKEIETMKNIGSHVNVIAFLGCSTWNGRLLMVVEYARYGNLRDFLRERLNMTSSDQIEHRLRRDSLITDVVNGLYPPPYELLVSFAYQVARGLEYLSSKSVVHRDVACRNVLLANDLVVKIADFGLTRIVEEQTPYYRRNSLDLLPIRWMSPESLSDSKYTVKSDVWSFGVLLWEIFSFGNVPYSSVPVENLHSQLRSGLRLEKPTHATNDIYQTMTSCWSFLPSERPTFSKLVQRLESTLSRATAADYLLLDERTDREATSIVSDEDVFERNIIASHVTPQTRTTSSAMTRTGDSQYSSWSSDHTGSDASRAFLLRTSSSESAT